MGCVQDKNQSPVVQYENAIGNSYATISGKDVTTTQIVIAGVTTSGNERIFAYDVLQGKFKALVVPQGMSLWNYSSIVQLSDKEIMITGGLSANASEISNQAYIYDSVAGRAVRLPNMGQHRYTHLSTFFKGKLYVFGGRDYGEDDSSAIRSQCERFNFTLHKWEKISRLNIPRCTGFTFIYKDSIYVCGGLTGEKQRSRAIERYDESNDRWIQLDVKLSRGMECGTLLPASHFFADPQLAKDRFVILGGNTEEGSQDTMFIYNLAEESVVSGPNLNQRRVLQKTLAYQQKIVVFGGCEADGVEVFDQNSQTWKENAAESFSMFVQPMDIDLFSYSQPPIVITDFVPPVHKSNQGLNGQQQQQQLKVQDANASLRNSTIRQMNKSNASINDVELVMSSGLNVQAHSSRMMVMNSKSQQPDELSAVTKSLIKEDLLIEKAYLFGTDVDPYIMEIDFHSIKIEKKPTPLSIRLFEHQGVVRLPQQQQQQSSQFILIGGVHDGKNKTVKYTYSYDSVSHSGKRLANMLVPAYAFATLVDSTSIYVFGGKQSLKSKESESTSSSSSSQQFEESSNNTKQQFQSNVRQSAQILSACQRYNSRTDQWYGMPNLNVKRVAAMATMIFKKIFVFGGYKGDGEQVRPNEIEVYDPNAQRPTWVVLQSRFPIGLEGAHLMKVREESSKYVESILLFGGRTSSGEIKFISKLSFEKPLVNNGEETSENQNGGSDDYKAQQQLQLLQVKLEKVGQMRQSRCHHKMIQPYRSIVLILGGKNDPIVECVNIDKDFESAATSSIPHVDAMVSKMTLAIKRTKDSSLAENSFAY